MKTLITGGAGFIGTHLSRKLLQEGVEVRIFDNFNPQVHSKPCLHHDLQGHVELIQADVRDRDALHKALANCDAVVHLAAETGTGQSMYQVAQYEQVNVGGTAHLIDYLMNYRSSRVTRLITASSRAIYGEGKYFCTEHQVVYPEARRSEDMMQGFFEPRCPHCSNFCEALPTDENSPLHPLSFYGLTKQMQEQMTLLCGKTLGISAFALRYQNVYGPGQSLTNPYTGILAIFSSRARENMPIHIFEDGRESRDFVYVHDVVETTWRCLQAEQKCIAMNVGSGARTRVEDVAHEIVSYFESASTVTVNGAFRLGDIRHNVADLARMQQITGCWPLISFPEGIRLFLEWVQEQDHQCKGYERSLEELRSRGLMQG